ncbi:unnamed protein product [Alternaria alternata]
MPPKNISTGAYWKEDPTDAPHRDVETDFETSESSESEPPTSHKKFTTSDNLEDNLVTVSHDSTPSSTASDVALKAPLEDTMEAQNLDRQGREQGLSNQERKEKLINMLGNGTSDRDTKETSKDDEDDGENRSEGKGKGKKV